MEADKIKTVAIVGAGTMGAGIAGEFARAGCDVRLVDRSSELLNSGMAFLRLAQNALTDAGQITEEAGDAALARVRLLCSMEEACAGVELVVETVTENLEIKRSVLSQAECFCPKDAIFASNTSGLSITEIADATSRPARVAGMHFFNPPHVIPLVEVTKGAQTSSATAQLLMDLSKRLGKRPILVKRDVPGFVANRLQFAVMREALHILSEGIASADDIDTAMTAGPGLRYALMGPLRTADLGGLDVFHKISQYLFAELNSETTPSPVLADLVAEGKLGAKTEAGIYDYPPHEVERILGRRDRILLEFLRVLSRDGAEAGASH